jgi:peroxiredoxin
MKKIIIVAGLFLIISSCKEKSNGVFTVAGTIKNAPSNKVYLKELPFGGTNPIVVDSATLQNGKFELNTNTLEEGLYSIGFETFPNAVLLINDAKKIEVNLDFNNYKSYETKGSKATTALHELFSNYEKSYGNLEEKILCLDSLQGKKASDSLVTIARLQKNNEKQHLNQLLNNFINSTESPAACLQALAMATRTMEMDELSAIIEKSVSKFSSYANIKKLQQIIIGKQYPLLGKQAPAFALGTPTNDTIALSNFKGKYVLVDFWASWCAPCRAENPNVVAMYHKYKDKNFTILGVSLDRDLKAWTEAIKKDSLTWTHASDLKQWESPLVSMYQFDGIPFNVLIDPTGKIIASGLREEGLDKKLSEVLR